MKNYKDIIRQLLEEKKWGNIDLAEATGLAKHYISELITDGKRPKPSYETLEKIAHAFGHSVTVFSDELNQIDAHYAEARQNTISFRKSKIQPYLKKCIEVLESTDELSVDALEYNIDAFHAAKDAKLSDAEQKRLNEELLERIARLEEKDRAREEKPPEEGSEPGPRRSSA